MTDEDRQKLYDLCLAYRVWKESNTPETISVPWSKIANFVDALIVEAHQLRRGGV